METKEIIINMLKSQIPGLSGIYIYGSFVDNRLTPQSDIDIGFISTKKIDRIERWEIQEKLASKLNRDADLVDLKDASVMKMHRLYCALRLLKTGNEFSRAINTNAIILK